jgi:hypothetical protein
LSGALIDGCFDTSLVAILEEANDDDYRQKGGVQTAMIDQPRKMSEVLEEMSKLLLRHPRKVPSSGAAHVAVFFANAAWNDSVGLAGSRENYRHIWEAVEIENPELWNEFKSNNINAMIDELVEYKEAHYPNDRRRILICGIHESSVRVEWIPEVAPGVDFRWETQLYGLLTSGQREKAIRFIQETRGVCRGEAETRVAVVEATLEVG